MLYFNIYKEEENNNENIYRHIYLLLPARHPVNQIVIRLLFFNYQS